MRQVHKKGATAWCPWDASKLQHWLLNVSAGMPRANNGINSCIVNCKLVSLVSQPGMWSPATNTKELRKPAVSKPTNTVLYAVYLARFGSTVVSKYAHRTSAASPKASATSSIAFQRSRRMLQATTAVGPKILQKRDENDSGEGKSDKKTSTRNITGTASRNLPCNQR